MQQLGWIAIILPSERRQIQEVTYDAIPFIYVILDKLQAKAIAIENRAMIFHD